MENSNELFKRASISFMVLVASLGYFVDAYDLLVFSVVRSRSIVDLQLATNDTEIKNIGISLENWQSLGLLIGGIVWGVLGDKIGRRKILYFSIAFYSVANLLNGFLSPNWTNLFAWYSALRFLCGFGLAGELGIGITLVAETIQTTKRGLGTMIVAAVGFLGAVTAAWLSQLSFIKWNYLFIIGGIAGILLLLLRFRVCESLIFKNQKKSILKRGAFFSIFSSISRFRRFLCCILVGLPVYFVIGLPIKFAGNFGQAFNIKGVTIPTAIITCYIFVALGDILCNYLSQLLKSRKIPLILFNCINLIAVILFVFLPPRNAFQYLYIYCPILGFSVGYWALIVTTSAEQFGTNLRATVATAVPNFIRSTFIPIAILFTYLDKQIGTIYAAAIVGLSCSIIGVISAFLLDETFFRKLDYSE